MWLIGQGIFISDEVLFDRFFAIDIARSPKLLSNGAESDLIDKKIAIITLCGTMHTFLGLLNFCIIREGVRRIFWQVQVTSVAASEK